MSLRRTLTLTTLAALTLATASVQAQTTAHNGGRLRALIAQKQAAAAPAVLAAGVQRIADVPYGADPAQRMDVYVPTSPTTGTNSLVASAVRAPVIFMVHGGGWRHGDKAMGRVVQEKVNRWVPKGFILISINYRMLPDAPVAVQERDVQAALMAAQQRAGTWGGDPSRFILMGHSAGAHLVALLNARAPQALREGAWPWLGTVSLDSAMMNVPARMRAPHLPLYDDAFGTDPAYWVAMSPFHQWTAGAPPMQMVCSTQRADDPCQQSDAMARHVRNQGGRAEVLPQDLDHGEINAQLGLDSDYTRAVEAFMGSLDAEVARRLQ
ncbi:acetyl esterase/lipase [Acidovorax sp. 93]|uniref:alpha/beta hydrolase n=1 Tax=unclassified Acidovorax TaxID=2684926 RepID=UPI000EB5D92F|nr:MULTISPECIES: alpha/beta hydrolase [unclassified Acidovorax]MBV7461446.1 alpha/beta hydrolase [Acidovorax sp. sif0632]MBV7466450.1 alpha/beta hydrolase [Acidovorax sp. sif0613]RKR28890.1 acetyl esterase/lipase [Acidovorax sp. 93]